LIPLCYWYIMSFMDSKIWRTPIRGHMPWCEWTYIVYHDLYHLMKMALRRQIKHIDLKVSCFSWYKQSNWSENVITYSWHGLCIIWPIMWLYIHDMGSVSWPILWLYLTPRYISVKGGKLEMECGKGFPWLIYLHSYINNK
jgi:hypothetical protein